MRALRLAVSQVGYEQRSYWRNPSSAVFTFAFPVLMLVIFASINRSVTLTAFGMSYNQYFVPGIAAFGVISACYSHLAIVMCFRRDQGVLKRLRGTPLPPWAFMAGNIGSSLLVSAILVALITGTGVAFYGVAFPGRVAALALAVSAGAFCFCAVGLALTTVVPNATAAPAVVNGLLFPILFISGTFYPLDPGSFLARLAEVFPIVHFQRAMIAVFDPAAPDPGLAATSLLVMLAWGLGALVVAVRRFRWEPRAR